MRCRVLVPALVVISIAPPARAEEPAAPAPAFVRLGPAESAAAVDLSLFDGPQTTIERLDLRLEKLSDGGAGCYGEISADRYGDRSGISDLDLGVMARHEADDDVDLVGRIGLALPTVSDESAAVSEALLTDASDAVVGVRELLALRLAVSPILRSGIGRIRFDAGLDLPIAGEDLGLDALVHLDVAAGFVVGRAGGAMELQMVGAIGDGNREGYSSVLATAQYYLGRTVVYGGLGTSLDAQLRDQFPYTLALGVRARI